MRFELQKSKIHEETLVHLEGLSEKMHESLLRCIRRHTRTVEANEAARSAGVNNSAPEIVRYKCNNNNNINSNAEINANNSKNATAAATTKPEVIRHHVTPMTSLPMALAQELELARKKEEEEQINLFLGRVASVALVKNGTFSPSRTPPEIHSIQCFPLIRLAVLSHMRDGLISGLYCHKWPQFGAPEKWQTKQEGLIFVGPIGGKYFNLEFIYYDSSRTMQCSRK